MASFAYWGAVALAIGVGGVGVSAGCGGSSFSAAGSDSDASNSETGGGASGGGVSSGGGSDSSTSDGSSSGTTSGDGAPGSSGAGTTDGAASGDASASDSASGDGATGVNDATSPACPNVAGSYTITLTQAAGCGNLNVIASQCIRNNGGCGFELPLQRLRRRPGRHRRQLHTRQHRHLRRRDAFGGKHEPKRLQRLLVRDDVDPHDRLRRHGDHAELRRDPAAHGHHVHRLQLAPTPAASSGSPRR